MNATNADHIQASMTQLQFWGGWFANPIFVNGQYPDVMREKVKEFDSLYIWQSELQIISFFGYVYVRKYPKIWIFWRKHGRKNEIIGSLLCRMYRV